MEQTERTYHHMVRVGKTEFRVTVTYVRDDELQRQVIEMWARFLVENLTAPKEQPLVAIGPASKAPVIW